MKNQLSHADSKKPYEPPQLNAISLRPEEAVLGHCKIFGQSGGNSLAICGLLCPTAGS